MYSTVKKQRYQIDELQQAVRELEEDNRSLRGTLKRVIEELPTTPAQHSSCTRRSSSPCSRRPSNPYTRRLNSPCTRRPNSPYTTRLRVGNQRRLPPRHLQPFATKFLLPSPLWTPQTWGPRKGDQNLLHTTTQK